MKTPAGYKIGHINKKGNKMNETIKHIPIQVIVIANGQKYAKQIGVSPWLGQSQIDEYVTAYVDSEWSNVRDVTVSESYWVYV